MEPSFPELRHGLTDASGAPTLPGLMDPNDLGDALSLGSSSFSGGPRLKTVLVVPDVVPRVLAKLLDLAGAGVLYCLCTLLVPHWMGGALVGAVVAGTFVLVSDGLDLAVMPRHSAGKEIMKLSVERLDGERMTPVVSTKRNWMFAVGFFVPFFAAVAPALGLLAALTAVGLIGYEVYWVATSDLGCRWGDDLAGTDVRRPMQVPIPDSERVAEA